MAPARRLHRPTLRYPAPYSDAVALGAKCAVFVGAVGVVLGAYGYANVAACPARAIAQQNSWLDVIWKSLALLVMQATPDPCDTVVLQVARLLAAVATLGGLTIIAVTQLHGIYTQLRLARLAGHTVVITIGDRGRSFIRSLSGTDIVTLDLDPSAWSASTATGALHAAVGDALNDSNLRAINAHAAERVLILGDDDTANLQVLQNLLSERRPPGRRQQVIVRIDNEPLSRALNAQDAFVSDKHGRVVLAFNEDRVAAIRFNDLHPLAELADRRGLHRVHLVMVGQTAFALAVLEQFVRISPFKDFEPPRVDFIVDDPEALESLLATTRPAFLDRTTLSPASLATPTGTASDTVRPLPPLLELHLWPTDKASGLPSPEVLETIEPGPAPSVTAILVSATHDADAVSLALRVRSMTVAAGRWAAPVFVRSRSDAAVATLLDSREHAGCDPQLQIIPVGLRSDTCSAEACFGAREEAAENMHAAYLASRQQEHDDSQQPPAPGSVSPPPPDSAQPWTQLPAQFKARNRRAVDHLPQKLLSAGCVIVARPLSAASAVLTQARDVPLERLAALEHAAWEADLRTDGWRGGEVRDDRRQIHDCIGTDFTSLSPRLQAFDIDQLRYADRMLTAHRRTAAPTVLRETRLGIFGHNRVSDVECAALVRSVPAQLRDAFSGEGRPEFVSVLTPLAPGSDTVLTELTLRWLSEQAIPHRLVVVRSLPREVVVAQAAMSGLAATVWSLEYPRQDATAKTMQNRLELLERETGSARHATIVADLQPPGLSLGDWQRDDALRVAAFQRANAYISQRAQCVLAFVDPQRGPGRPGGAAEALSWCRDRRLIATQFRHHGAWHVSQDPVILLAGMD